MDSETDQLLNEFDKISAHVTEQLRSGSRTSLREYIDREDVDDIMRKQLRESVGQAWMKDHISVLLNMCKIAEQHTEIHRSDMEMFDITKDILGWYSRPLNAIAEDSEDFSGEAELWSCLVEIVKISLRSGNPVLLHTFSWAYRDEFMMWQNMKETEWTQFLEIVLSVIPKANISLATKKAPAMNNQDQFWNAEMSGIFSEIMKCIQTLPEVRCQLRELIITRRQVAIVRLADGLPTKKEDTVLHYIFIRAICDIQEMGNDMCLAIVPELEILKDSGHMTEMMSSLASLVMRKISEDRNSLEDAQYIQRQIDRFIEDQVLDYSQGTPELLLKSYAHIPELIHRNIWPLSAKLPQLPFHHAVNLFNLFKQIANSNIQLFTRDIIANLYVSPNNPMICSHPLEILTKCCQHDADLINLPTILEFCSSNPIYIGHVSQMLILIGTHDSCNQEKAEEIISWLLPRCTDPANYNYRSTILMTAKAIGQKFKRVLQQYKPLIVTLSNDPVLKDMVTSLLDFLEDRSLAGVTQKVEEHDEELDVIAVDISDTQESVLHMGDALSSVAQQVGVHDSELEVIAVDLVETKGAIDKIGTAVARQGDGISDLSNQVVNQQEEIRSVRAGLAEAFTNIERIERQAVTIGVTPEWAAAVAELMNPDTDHDWTLMGKRLGYTTDRVRDWASQDNPCLSLLEDWFSAHISSEATRALYIVLRKIDRDDAAQIIADVMQHTVLEVTRGTVNVTSAVPRIDETTVRIVLDSIKSEPAIIDLRVTNVNPYAVATAQHTELTYDMTETRGRALIISNTSENPDGTRRGGAQHDHHNIKLMFESFGFVTSGELKNYTAKNIVKAIHRETQLVNPTTGESVHKHLGMFVLVIASHGSEGCIVGSDDVRVKLTDIYNMLSPKNFPQMKGKPKLVIIQACGGGNSDTMFDHPPTTATNLQTPQQMPPPDSFRSGDLQVDGPQDISVADLFIMTSSFDSFVSPRNANFGSPFIRAVVVTFYKFAHQHELQSLGNIIREVVCRYSVEMTELLKQSLPAERQQMAYVVQMPKILSTLVGLREVFLQPSVSMRQATEHPDGIVNAIYPNPPQTRIRWLADTLVEITDGSVDADPLFYTRWMIEKVTSPQQP